MFYHASKVKDLKVLEPRISDHGVPLIYFSQKRENVLVYLSNAVERYCRENGFSYDGPWKKWGPYGFDPDGILRIEEYYPGMLEEAYQGAAGYIYGVAELHPSGYPLNIPDAVTASKPVQIDEAEYVPDALEAILAAEKQGLIRILRYQDFPEKKKQWLRGVIRKEYEDAAEHPEYRYFLRDHFAIPGGLAWEPIRTEHLVRDRWIDFRREEYLMPDGTTFSPFYNYSKRDYAVILAVTEEGKYLCVKQYRHGIRRVTTEFVAGGLEYQAGKPLVSKEEGMEGTTLSDKGEATAEAIFADIGETVTEAVISNEGKDGATMLPGMKEIVYEDALDAAKRELMEETGYQSEEWEKLITLPSHATLSDDYVHVFIARNCHKVSGQELDDTEFLNVVCLTDEELETLIAGGNFQQCVHVMAWYMAKAQGRIS